jgi:hypothetical protein
VAAACVITRMQRPAGLSTLIDSLGGTHAKARADNASR